MGWASLQKKLMAALRPRVAASVGSYAIAKESSASVNRSRGVMQPPPTRSSRVCHLFFSNRRARINDN